jgi:type III secretion protein Q
MSEIDAFADRPNASGATGDMRRTGVIPRSGGAGFARFKLTGAARLTQEQARLSHMIGRGCHLELSPHKASFSLNLARDKDADWSDPLTLTGAFGSVVIADGPRLLRGLTGIDLRGQLAADDERWDWMQAALVARLSGTPFSKVQRIEREAHPEDSHGSILCITLRTGDHAIVTHARAGGADWLRLLGQSAWTQERLPFSAFARLPYQTRLRIASHTLPRHALKGLAPGDFILPDQATVGIRGVGYLQIGVLYAKVRFQEPNSFTLSRAEVKLDSPELKPDPTGGFPDPQSGVGATPYLYQPPAEPLADVAAMDNVPVTLHFELGNLRMLLGELRALAPDAVIVFNGSTASVAIRCGDRLLGHGELVDVQGQLGIRILDWGPKW